MPSSIDSAPDLLRPAGQPLIFKFSTSATVTAGFRFAVRVYESTTTPVRGRSLGLSISRPTQATRDTSTSPILPRDAWPLPTHTTTWGSRPTPWCINGYGKPEYKPRGSCVLYYRVGVQDYTGGTLNVSDDATADIYLLGGAQQISQGLHPSFSTYYPTTTSTKGWLTDRTLSNKNITMTMADEDEGVGVVCHTTNLGTPATGPRLNSTSTRTGPSYNSGPYGDGFRCHGGQLLHLSHRTCQPSDHRLRLGHGMPTGTNYASMATDGDLVTGGSSVRAHLIINRDCRPIKHDPVQLAWANTVGAWDYLRFDGRNLKTLATESKDYRKSVGFDFKAWDRQATPYHKTGKESYQLRNQLFTADERDLLQYAFRSKNVMFRVGSGEWLPCNIVTNTYQVIPAASKTFDVSFQIELAQDIRC